MTVLYLNIVKIFILIDNLMNFERPRCSKCYYYCVESEIRYTLVHIQQNGIARDALISHYNDYLQCNVIGLQVKQ